MSRFRALSVHVSGWNEENRAVVKTDPKEGAVESHAALFGPAIHPMLIVFPLGLLATAAIFHALYMVTSSVELTTFSFWAIAAGVMGGPTAAVFGLWDWLAIPGGTRVKGIGAWHGIGNVVMVGLFTGAWIIRTTSIGLAWRPDGLPFILEIVAVFLALVTGWLGGELVERLGVSVDPGAHLDAPSSLTQEQMTPPGTPSAQSDYGRPSA
jgi:uncharacterized membrane protein